MTHILRICIALSFLLSTGCQAAFREWQQDRLASHLSKVTSYHGILRESGVTESKEDLISEVWFEQPLQYFVRVTAPEKYAGSTLTYDGKSLFLYFPKTKYGILYRNLPQLTPEAFKALMDKQFNYNMDHFNYELGKAGKVAGYGVVDLLFRPKSKDSLIQAGFSKVYDAFSFPLSGELIFSGDQKYKYSFDSIQFNVEVPKGQFSISQKSAEVLSEWNFESKGLSEADAKKAANFSFKLPSSTPAGFTLQKIIRQSGPIPAFITIYEKPPYFVYVVSFKDYGFSLAPTGRGVRLNGKNSGELLPNPHLSSYSFAKEGVQYGIVGNIPVDELVQIARSL